MVSQFRTVTTKAGRRPGAKLGIVTLALIDTDCDPDLVDLPIPGNDDGIRSIEIIVRQLADAIIEGTAASVTKDAKQPTASTSTPAPEAEKGDEAPQASEEAAEKVVGQVSNPAPPE